MGSISVASWSGRQPFGTTRCCRAVATTWARIAGTVRRRHIARSISVTVTDMPRFIRLAFTTAALVSSRLAAQQPAIPTPESSLGFTVGADFKLATYDESIAYFQKLASASSRIRLVDVGKTSTG